MYVARIPNRGSPPAILLRESYRAGGKVRNRTLANLSRWPEEKIDALSRVLKGLPPQAAPEGAFEIVRSLPHGHVAAVLGTLGALGLQEGAALRDGDQLPRPGAFVLGLRRGRPLRGDGLALPPPAGYRGRPRPPAPERRHARPLRRLLGRLRGPHLPPRRDLAPESRRARPAPDRLRAACDQPRHPDRGRGRQGQQRRPGDAFLAGQEAEGALLAQPRLCRRGPGDADEGPP